MKPERTLSVHLHLNDIAAVDWNALLASSAEPTPFMRHEFLVALDASGSATEETGWRPLVLALRDADGTLVGVCMAYLKGHSYGEYVFDWAWADAYRRHGLEYYPKLLCAVPFTPVPGSRLLARDDEARRLLLEALLTLVRESQLSSAHVLFMTHDEREAAREAGWMIRPTVQFHWRNRTPVPYGDFDEFTSTLQRDKRKKIGQERRRVAEAGVGFDVLQGPEIDSSAWDFFHRCYTLTYRAHHSTPYLTRDFFRRMQHTLPEHWVMFVARRGQERIGASLLAVDADRKIAWGRYWGSIEHVPLLHFEACYYQPLQWCIEQGYLRFEGGAQGEHKMARGFLPERTASAHWISDARFARAIDDFVAREGQGTDGYVDELESRNPFKPAPP